MLQNNMEISRKDIFWTIYAVEVVVEKPDLLLARRFIVAPLLMS